MKELKPPFKVGDKIKFKDWELMIKEYGKAPFSDQPDVYYGMPRYMYDEYKNTVFTIKEITLDKYNHNCEVWDIKTKEPHSYSFQSQMFKLAKPEKRTTKQTLKDSLFFTKEEQVKILNELEVIISKIKD